MRHDTQVWMQANGFPFEMEDLVSMTVDEIMEKTGARKTTAYDLRKAALAEQQSAGANPSLAQEILGILKVGPVNDVQTLREALSFKGHGASSQDVTRAVWSLQKRALVTFYEKKAGHDSILHKIKLTPRGMGEMGILPDRDDTKPGRVRGSKELKRRSPVGKDMTDPYNQPSVTVGGPVEVINGHTPVQQEVVPATEYKIVAPPPISPLNQNEKPETPADPYRGFPILRHLAERREQASKLEAAAELLIDIDPDTAQALLDKIKLTDIEKEYLHYASAHGD